MFLSFKLTFKEPWAGNIYKNPILLSPGSADFINLEPFYSIIHDAIRTVDKDALVFFESVTWDNFKVGFTAPPGGAEYANKSVLSYHHYHDVNLLPIAKTFQERIADVSRLNCGLMMTEFDIAYYGDHNMFKLINSLNVADEYLQSWIG